MDNVSNLAMEIPLLAQKLTMPATPSTPKAKIREPDMFDGMEQHQLHTFLLQCSLNFRDYTDTFANVEAKVTYALSFLTGSTLDCFEPYLHDPTLPPPWLTNYTLFHKELESNFRLFDSEGEAKVEIEVLWMTDGKWATKYFVEFNPLTLCISWGKPALC